MLPSLSRTTSCGSMVCPGNEYSVTTTLVESPLRAQQRLELIRAQVSDALRLTVARYCAGLRNCCGVPARDSSSIFCGLVVTDGPMASHAMHHLHEFIRIMGRQRDPLARMAAGAVEDWKSSRSCRVCSSSASASVNWLAGKFFVGASFKSASAVLPGATCARRRGENITDGADGERVMAGREPRRREMEIALGIGGHAHRDDRPRQRARQGRGSRGGFGSLRRTIAGASDRPRAVTTTPSMAPSAEVT